MQFPFYPLFLFCWLNLPVLVHAQLIDDFSDGNFTYNPTWFGQDSLFQVNASKQLQSRAYNNQVGDRVLFTHQSITPQMEWRVWMRFAFNPSTQNQVRWILSANDTSLKNAYYVQLGGSTGTSDSISLYKEVNGQKFCLIAGRPATVGKSNNLVQLKVTRNPLGQWELFSDTGTTAVFMKEGSAQDSSISLGNWHGFTFRCTSGNVGNFYADEVYAGEPIVDKTSPKIIGFEMLNLQQITLHFSEKINQIETWQIGFSQLQKAQASSTNQQTWLLQLDKPIIPDSFFTLSLNQISDLANNTLDTQIVWAYHALQKGDIIITELLPDPDPVLGLPNAEFVELHNNTRFPVALKDMSISDPSSQGNIPQMVVGPWQFILLCAAKDTALFKPFGTTIGLNAWPSLNNSSDTIRLKCKEEIWQEIPYHLSYYQNKEKELGGYSLSLINPNHLCWGAANWIASTADIGGTPGKINDVWVAQKDSNSAQLSQVQTINSTQIELHFNKEIMFQDTWKNQIQQQGIAIENIGLNSTWATTLRIQLYEPMQHLKVYQFEIYPLVDCLQNKGKQKVQFTYLEPKAPKQNELIITEIYYDQTRKGNFPQQEFIELYNQTAHPINLQNMQFSDATNTAKLPHYLLPAKSYVIVCPQSHASAFSSFGKTLGLTSWPSLNTSDILSIKDSNSFLLHQVNYADSWLKNTDKNFSCSIEIIDVNNPCGGENNWQASLHPNGASPGEKNSVSRENPDKQAPHLIRLYVRNSNEIQLHFNEQLDSLSLLNPLTFGLNQNIYPSSFYMAPNERNFIHVLYENSLQENTDYVMQMNGIQDCAFNETTQIQSLSFQVPKAPKLGDLIINELLFNPQKNAYDFIELYNVSDVFLDLSKLQLCRLGNGGILEEYQLFAEEGIQIAPDYYMTISEIPVKAQNTNFSLQARNWISHKIPAMNDDEGTVMLINEQGIVLDSVYYSEKMHVSFLKQTEGVSLEKINPHQPGYLGNNWISAAETENFSTPCKKNSQHRLGSGQSGKFSCGKPYYSPDSDGNDELITFEYQTGGGQWLADLFIYNTQGQLVKEVCKSKLLANSGELHWAGDTNTGERAPIGNYIAYWNCYSNMGQTEQQKVVISLLSR